MKTLASIGFLSSLSILTFGWIPAAMSEAIAPEAPPSETRSLVPQHARDLSKYVYLHVTRNQSTSMQGGTRANTCRGAS